MDLTNKEQVRKVVKGCKNGNQQSQRILYEALYNKMLGVCMRYSSEPNEAKDLVQDGFITVFKKNKTYNFKGSLEGWIRKLIVNNAIDQLRKKKKMLYSFEEESGINNMEDTGKEETEEKKLLHLKAETIVRLIQKLTPAYRAVFNMYVIEDMSHKEIAKQLDISIGSSKSNLSKAKVRLRKLYIEYIEKHDD
ncbi:MAG: sigma-70 family RNA polymerase sigma factor [Candidatus Delongbacteria bacterium]|jgi:RNA polymerase sigma-70 factor (ECF subfamily)|nr:sigma-70 family RNA polymerase sigma factor [Candidatus Delongbacteria bacterium]